MTRAGHKERRSGKSKERKTTRIRTVLTEKQQRLLWACYRANPRPDALMKEQLVEMTGLNPRVIRVWFQNKRCKDNKRATEKIIRGGRISDRVRIWCSPYYMAGV